MPGSHTKRKLMETKELKKIIEALIFASDHPLSIERIAGVIEGVEKTVIREAIKELREDYEKTDGALKIEQVAGGFQIRTRFELNPWLKRFFKTGLQRVSRAAMETLAIVAYRQPVTRAELESIRGVDSSGVFRTLLDKRLIKVVGRKDVPGRPPVYGTTRDFLETFDLKDLSSLPTLKEIELEEADLVAELASLEDSEVTLGAAEALEGEENFVRVDDDALLEALEKEEGAEQPSESGEEIGAGKVTEDTLEGGDSVETQGRADDHGRESQGKPEEGS